MNIEKVVFSEDSKWFNGEKDYMPYCLNCSTMWRMSRTINSAKCKYCGETFEISEELLKKFEEINGEKWA